MKRFLYNQLVKWSRNSLRMPLIIRGARQVGKSWLVRKFGEEFEQFVELNFEKDKEIHQFFARDLDIVKLLERITLYSQKKIIPGKTLLFLDEIQECPRAITALRYFKEECPELHVIAAGSLLDFALEEVGVPVGRVEFLFLYPLSFSEFLVAKGRDDLRQYLFEKPNDDFVHTELMEAFRLYMWVGGMPAVVDSWLKHEDINTVIKVQKNIITAYRQDFNKYARKNNIPYVETVFANAVTSLGNKFKYVDIDPDSRSQNIKAALVLLEKAGILYRCYQTSGAGLPFSANRNEKHFKVFFFDIGLAQRLLGLDLSKWSTIKLDSKHLGGMAEQFVAQELVAYGSIDSYAELFYWHRESKSSNAEVDFLIAKEGNIIPVEVKAGVKGGMKSMRIFLETYANSPYGVKISEVRFSTQDNLLNVPFYGIESWLSESSVK